MKLSWVVAVCLALCAPWCHADALLAPQPAGLAPPCSDRAAWGSDAVRARAAAVVADAPRLAERPMPAWDDDAYLDYSRTGQRPRGERMMNARKAQLYPLVLAECVQWQGRYVAAIERALLALSEQPTWTWPAHDVSLRNFRDRQYDVDLMAADTANEIAQTLHLMGDRIGAATRRTAAGFLEAQKSFRKIQGIKDLWILKAALGRLDKQAHVDAAKMAA
jgi:hypothetical protein